MQAEFGETLGVPHLAGGFKYFLIFIPIWEESHFDSYFSNGLKPPTSHRFLETYATTKRM